MGWGTQRLRVQWCATIPHCAPLECGDWRCRAAIDISLLWSERHRCTKIQETASIVGARSPRPVGWGTQRLRVQGCATIPHCVPLERKAPTHQNSRCVMHRRGGVASPDGLGNPTPTDSPTRFPVSHVAPLGLWLLGHAACYKHVAPLGL